jgi:hypothetical protein
VGFDAVAAWTGVIGAAVGGGFAYLISRGQNAVTRSEGKADRAHDREMRLWDSRATSYVKALDFAGRVAAWKDAIRAAVTGDSDPTALPPEVQWTDEEWYTMMAHIRAVGGPKVLEAFTNFQQSAKALNDRNSEKTQGRADASVVIAACDEVHNAAVQLRIRISEDLQSNH